jgi:uncharacterized damage-inducible protein DinB
MNQQVTETALAALAARITRVFPEQVRAAVAPLDDDQIWWRPNETSNAIGNLLLHLSGSLDHFLNRNIGGIEYQRDRVAEFAERRRLPKAEVLARFDEMVARARRTFDSLTPERLGAPSPEPRMHALVVEDLINIAVHLSTHAGQIVWIAKMLREGAVDEVWIRTHKEQGAWRPRGA